MSLAGRTNENLAAIHHVGLAREGSGVMAEGQYLMGIDFGTGGVRVGIFDAEGTPVVFAERAFTLKHPRPGWAEQDPDEWWDSLVEAVRAAMEESGVPAEEIASISVDATSSTVLAIDGGTSPAAGHNVDGRSLLRPGRQDRPY